MWRISLVFMRLARQDWLLREHRGIYRLADFHTAERPDLMLWYLWSQNRQEVLEGTYSHDTALSLHKLSDNVTRSPSRMRPPDTTAESNAITPPSLRAMLLRTPLSCFKVSGSYVVITHRPRS